MVVRALAASLLVWLANSWAFSFKPNQLFKTLLVDNYDSYTYNLYQLISKVNGVPPCVVYNDACGSDLQAVLTKYGPFDNIVLSPGPGSPDRKTDFGICGDLLTGSAVPILGVCLGHQGLGYFAGGDVIKAPEPMHGRYSPVYHSNQGIFKGIPQGFDVVRYHSLAIDHNTLPSSIAPSAWAVGPGRKAVLMGVSHLDKPQWGVQFHPESIGTQYGEQILANFNALTKEWKVANKVPFYGPPPGSSSDLGNVETHSSLSSELGCQRIPPFQSVAKRLEFPDSSCPDIEAIFSRLYLNSSTSYWLDSCGDLRSYETTSSGTTSGTGEQGRFSYMGSHDGKFGSGSLGRVVEYRSGGQLNISSISGKQQILKKPLFSYLKELTSSWGVDLPTYMLKTQRSSALGDDFVTGEQDFPFDFKGGLVGCLGYEMRHDASDILSTNNGEYWSPDYNISISKQKDLGSCTAKSGNVPDAFLILSDRLVVYDHHNNEVFLVAVDKNANGHISDATYKWMKDVEKELSELCKELLVAKSTDQEHRKFHQASSLKAEREAEREKFRKEQSERTSLWKMQREEAQYYSDVNKAQQFISEGETYEVCLTNKLERKNEKNKLPEELYKAVRRNNPAQYAAFLKHDPHQHLKPLPNEADTNISCTAFAILCTSPERFLKLGKNSIIESKPIKGTARRFLESFQKDEQVKKDLATCQKNQAENLMIVDLLRNDLGRVCKLGSIRVPRLMNIETFATVHQLVSTIQGELLPGCNIIDALVASFPGGSMTGAPKQRTLEIIHSLEKQAPRGIYSGSLGFVSLDGVSNFNIVIRTAVITPRTISVGAGGAIIALSDADGEFDEMLLKSETVVIPLSLALKEQGAIQTESLI